MEARSITPPPVNALLVGKHRSNAGRMARVVTVSPTGEHVCLWHGYRMAWNLTSSVLKNYAAASDDSGDILAIPGDKAVPALAVAPTERPDASAVEPLPATPEVEPVPTVAEVVQAEEDEPAVDAPLEAPAGRMLALFHGVPVAIGASPEAEPLVRDLTLAERLGYDRPRKIRDLIKRGVETGLLGEVHERPAVVRSSMPRGGTKETPVSEFWLTEAQALLVITRSDAPKAIAVSREIVAVYMAARRGLLTPAPAPAPVVDYAALGTAVAAAVASTVAPMLEAVVSRLTRPAEPPAPPPAAPPSNVKDINKERAFKAVWTEQAPIYRPLFTQFASQSLDRVDITRESERLRALTSGDLHKHFSSWLARRGVASPHPRVTYKLINEITTLYAGRTDDPSRQVRPFALYPQMVIEESGR